MTGQACPHEESRPSRYELAPGVVQIRRCCTSCGAPTSGCLLMGEHPGWQSYPVVVKGA